MEPLSTTGLIRQEFSAQPYESFRHDLRGICGAFNPHLVQEDDKVFGAARRIDVCGMEFAHISNDLDYVRRDWDDIRQDAAEHLFLILQMEGTCGVEHFGRQNVLDVGECILIDSTRPTTFYFNGKFSNHLSLHLPRQLMYTESKVDFDISRKLLADDPMAVMLRALVAKIMNTPESQSGASHLRDLVYNATRQAFLSDGKGDETLHALPDSASKRIQMVELLIDRHLTESDLSARWLATQLGVSIRTLQQDFQGMGVTCTTVIRDRRLHFARQKIEQLKIEKSCGTIAEVAYSAGFNDISYFNRSFKELFDCAPTDILRPDAAGKSDKS